MVLLPKVLFNHFLKTPVCGASLSHSTSPHCTIDNENNQKEVTKNLKPYNETKYGVDIIVQVIKKYSVNSPSKTWPVHTFYNILDLAAMIRRE